MKLAWRYRWYTNYVKLFIWIMCCGANKQKECTTLAYLRITVHTKAKMQVICLKARGKDGWVWYKIQNLEF